jgi:hypothetical protein
MIDLEKNLQKLTRLEAHVAWIRQNLGDGPALNRRLAEISKLRATIAVAAPTKCQLVRHSD